jgi:hypothetical protein
LLQNNSTLTRLVVESSGNLGVQEARALQRRIRGNQAKLQLSLHDCRLGVEGLSVIVDAILEGNTTISHLGLNNNNITAIGLRHVTRLLQQRPSSAVVSIRLDNNPGMFNNDEATRLFLSALRNTNITSLSLNFCQLSGQAFIALFKTAAVLEALLDLNVYDTQREMQDATSLLKVISNMSNICHLSIHLAFRNEAVLAAFHCNTSIRHLHVREFDYRRRGEIMDGPVFKILKRNRRLHKARRLLSLFPSYDECSI